MSKPGDGSGPGTSSGGALEPGRAASGLEGGVNPDQALLWNAGTCRSDVKGEAQAGDPREGESTDAGHRDGAVRSRDEGSVMGLDRRGCGIRQGAGGQPATGGGRMTKAKPFDIPKRKSGRPSRK